MDPEVIRSESAGSGWWFRGKADIVMELLPTPTGRDRLLDVGCGWGAVTEKLRPWGDVVGVEPSAAGREEARHRGVDAVEGQADSLPAESESQDIVLVTDVLEHVPDDAAAARELARVLRPGGTALVTVPAYPRLFGSHDRALSHHRRYTRDSIAAVLEGAGLEPRRVTHFNTLLFPLAMPIRLLRRNAPARADASWAPGPLDELLYRVFRAERLLLRRFDLPFGLSIAVVAVRPG